MATEDVILLCGQSNTESGSTTGMPLDLTVPQAMLSWIWYESSIGVVAINSGGWVNTLASQAHGQNVMMANRIGNRARCFFFAVSGTGLANKWVPSAAILYPQLLTHWAQAVADAAPTILVPKVLVWNQGETDCDALSFANAYGANLTALITQLRADIGAPQLRVVKPRISTANTSLYVANVRAGEAAAAAADPLITLIETSQYTTPPSYLISPHYSDEMAIDVGFLTADAILNGGMLTQ